MCIFTPVSLMNMKDSNGVSLLQYLTFTTEPNCIQDGLLSNEEMAAVALYKSKELHMSYQLDRKDISNLLAVNLQIILVDNSPLQSQYTYSSTSNIKIMGTCKPPVFEIVKNYPAVHNFIFNQEFKLQLQSNDMSL